MKIISTNEFKIVPWKNGQGFTHEILKLEDPTDSSNFLLRFSRATISQNGSFSTFEGIDRILIMLKGNGIQLKTKGITIPLSSSLDTYSFPGEEKILCELNDGVCEDFNIMIKRGWRKPSFQILHVEKNKKMSFPQIELYLYLASGKLSCHDQLISADSLIINDKDILQLTALEDSVIFSLSLD